METEEAQKRFYDLLWPHVRAVLRTAHILCSGDTVEAEDLTQDTMLKAYRAIDGFAPGTNAKSWLLSILRNARIDRLRSAASTGGQVSLQGLHQEPAEAQVAPEGPDREAAAENPQVLLEEFSDRQIIDALQALPEEIRWTLLLVDVSGFDHREAAQVLNVPVGTIKSRAHRGRAMLKSVLLPVVRNRGVSGDDE